MGAYKDGIVNEETAEIDKMNDNSRFMIAAAGPEKESTRETRSPWSKRGVTNTTAFPATSWIKASYRKHAQGRDATAVHDEWHVVFAVSGIRCLEQSHYRTMLMSKHGSVCLK